MKKYYCKDGQIVYVSISSHDPQKIIVNYKGRQYFRNKDAIGKTLFECDPRIKIGVGTTVLLKNLESYEELKIHIVPTTEKRNYRRAGGAYYGADVEIIHDSELIGETLDEAVCVTEYSPLGKAVVGHYSGDVICFNIPNGNEEKYQIMDVII